MLPLPLLLAVAAFANAQLTPSPTFTPPPADAGTTPAPEQTVPNEQWSNLLGDLLCFYEAQRSGELPDSNRVTWRNSSGLHDGEDAGLDLTGGYYDAGDYIKASYPLSWVLTSVCWGAAVFGQGYDLANQTAYLDEMLRWGLDWLIKAHPDNSTFYVQVGDDAIDNNYWGGDQDIPTPRPSYQVNDTNPGTDATAQASAAFSSCSFLYAGGVLNSTSDATAPTGIRNQTYADTLLQHAVGLWGLSVNASGVNRSQDAVPEVGDAYPSSGYGDDLTLAALFLALATSSPSTYQQALLYYSKYKLSGSNAVLNWDSKVPAIYTLLTELALARPSWGGSANLTGWRSEAERWMDGVAAGGKGGAYMTDGGLLYYPGDSDSASLNPALNAAMALTHYAPIASTSDKANAYLDFATSQVNYTLGDNPMSAVYVVGINPNSPDRVHSGMASGGDNINGINTDPDGPDLHVLYGAVVGGPDKDDKFWNIRSDYIQSEPALDYVAPMLTLAAFAVMNNAHDPYFTALQAGAYSAPGGHPCDDSWACHSGLSEGGKIALGVVISIVGTAFVLCIAWFVWRMRRR
ncbi:glycoside hydrolase family 9 protein [Calocera cornea HHB12733]|uniref:cellulase n=1 Tax=Calocera cornea HHB12733 TaxID=1353952 RepID=A0A165CIE9_9BASI|nr:glycoside hydrolase family 9 protein [Calocera cornea HHB12733]